MKIENKNYIFFDLDGTLSDSEKGIKMSLRVMLDHFGIKKTDEELTLFIGPPLWNSCPQYLGFNRQQCEEAIRVFRESYNSEGIYITDLFPGVLKMMDDLKARGKHLVVATGKPEDQAKVVTDYLKITPYFDFIAGSADVGRVTKDLVIAYAMENLGLTEKDRKNILMIGDREHDVTGASKNGIECAGVLWGYGSEEELKKSGATYLVKAPEELTKGIV